MPIITPRGVWGIFHCHQAIPEVAEFSELQTALDDSQRCVKIISDTLGLHLHNLVLKKQLALESIKDPLTGVLNRRGLKQALQERATFQNAQDNCAVLLLDIDHFKRFNDHYGHNIGDEALLVVVPVINDFLLPQEIFCRYGGEEFVVILPGRHLPEAIAYANQLRSLVENKVLTVEHKLCTNLTISIGVAMYPEDAQEDERLLKYADQALYQAKEQGRNRVVSYQHLSS